MEEENTIVSTILKFSFYQVSSLLISVGTSSLGSPKSIRLQPLTLHWLSEFQRRGIQRPASSAGFICSGRFPRGQISLVHGQNKGEFILRRASHDERKRKEVSFQAPYPHLEKKGWPTSHQKIWGTAVRQCWPERNWSLPSNLSS